MRPVFYDIYPVYGGGGGGGGYHTRSSTSSSNERTPTPLTIMASEPLHRSDDNV